MCGFRGVPERHVISFFARCPRVFNPRLRGRTVAIRRPTHRGGGANRISCGLHRRPRNGSNGDQHIASAVGCNGDRGIAASNRSGGWTANFGGGDRVGGVNFLCF